MARTLVNVSATIFALMMIVRALFTYIYPGKLPFSIAIIDWLIVIAGSGAAISSIFCFIKKTLSRHCRISSYVQHCLLCDYPYWICNFKVHTGLSNIAFDHGYRNARWNGMVDTMHNVRC